MGPPARCRGSRGVPRPSRCHRTIWRSWIWHQNPDRASHTWRTPVRLSHRASGDRTAGRRGRLPGGGRPGGQRAGRGARFPWGRRARVPATQGARGARPSGCSPARRAAPGAPRRLVPPPGLLAPAWSEEPGGGAGMAQRARAMAPASRRDAVLRGCPTLALQRSASALPAGQVGRPRGEMRAASRSRSACAPPPRGPRMGLGQRPPRSPGPPAPWAAASARRVRAVRCTAGAQETRDAQRNTCCAKSGRRRAATACPEDPDPRGGKAARHRTLRLRGGTSWPTSRPCI